MTAVEQKRKQLTVDSQNQVENLKELEAEQVELKERMKTRQRMKEDVST